MTVFTTSNKIIYLSQTGGTTNFTFDFPYVEAGAINVTQIDANGFETLLVQGPGASQYQLVLNTPISPNPTAYGGTVILGTALPLGFSLLIERILPLIQDTSLQNQGTLWQTVIEATFDYITMLVQQVNAFFSNVLSAPPTDPPGINYVIPAVAARANKALVFDSAGNVTAGVTPATGFISPVMAPVVGAGTLALARQNMGLGTAAVGNISGTPTGVGNDIEGFNGLSIVGGNLLPTDDPVLDVATANPTTIDLTLAATGTNRISTGAAGTALNYVLPAGGTLWHGWYVDFIVNAPVVTVAPLPGSNDVINFAPAGQPIQLGPGVRFRITTDALTPANWYVTEMSNPPAPPGGYLSIDPSTNVPNNNAAVQTIYYNPDVSGTCPVWVGNIDGLRGDFVNQPIANAIPLSTTFATGGNVYDIFAFGLNGANELAIYAGPAWANPATGARTTGLTRVRGVIVNAAATTVFNGGATFALPALQGTYLGSFRATGAGTVFCNTQATTQLTQWGIWNCYNRREISLKVSDPTASWAYTANTAAQFSHANQVNSALVLLGLGEERVFAEVSQSVLLSGAPLGSSTVVVPEASIGVGVGSVADSANHSLSASPGGTYSGPVSSGIQIAFPTILSTTMDLGTWVGVQQIYAVESVSIGTTPGSSVTFYGGQLQTVRLKWRG